MYILFTPIKYSAIYCSVGHNPSKSPGKNTVADDLQEEVLGEIMEEEGQEDSDGE